MSWLFSRALVAGFSDICSDGEQSALLSGNPIPQAYLSPDKMTAFSRLSRFGMTYKLLTENRGEELLTLYLAGFPVKTSAQQDEAQESQEKNPQCGNTWQELLGRYDLDTHSLKTAQCSLFVDLKPSSVILPRWGSMQNGELYLRQTLVRPIAETEYGSLLPTPMSSTGGANHNSPTVVSGKRHSMNLAGFAQKWPTPAARDGNSINTLKALTDGRFVDQLANRVKMVNNNILTTPCSRDWKGHTLTLNHPPNSGKLNPDWVEWLMNWPIKWSNLNAIDPKEFKRWQEASAKNLQDFAEMRTMQWDKDPSETPFRQQLNQQSEKQFDDSVQHLPRNITCESEMGGSHKESDLFVLRDEIYLQESKGENVQSRMCEQISVDEATIIPRVASNVNARVDRLKALGNGQVPLCAATAFKLLAG